MAAEKTSWLNLRKVIIGYTYTGAVRNYLHDAFTK